MKKADYINMLEKIAGSVIAVVYVFENDITDGFEHYDPWKSDVISDWLHAIQELHCMPFILDVRTFAQKAFNGTLPYIDYIVNLNAGTNNLSTLGLVPSICSFLNIPCIPTDTVTTVVGENKKLSNLIATALHSNVPEELPKSDANGIFRPLNFGSSHGVQKGFPTIPLCNEFIYQKFIPGFDMTIPIMFNPITEELECLPAIIYQPEESSINWFLGENEKLSHAGYKKQCVFLEESAQKHFLNLAKEFGIKTYCRIDTRVLCTPNENLNMILSNKIELQRINFIEINPLPTIKNDINFHTAFKLILPNSDLGKCIQTYNEFIASHTFVGFILSSSIIAFIKSMH